MNKPDILLIDHQGRITIIEVESSTQTGGAERRTLIGALENSYRYFEQHYPGRVVSAQLHRIGGVVEHYVIDPVTNTFGLRP
jgi:hypothetical protein